MIVAKKSKAPERVNAIALKESPEYKAWLDELADRSQIPTATIVRTALADWAAKHGHPAPPQGLRRRRGGA